MDEPEDWLSDALQVVVNPEGRHSIWPLDREPPDGWRAVGVSGTKEECLAYIRGAWTDMRPATLRKRMGG